MEYIENEDEQVPVRRVPIKEVGWKPPPDTKHSWLEGEPFIEMIYNVRIDICQKCGCKKRIIIRVGMRPWTDSYELKGENTRLAPKCPGPHY